MSYKAEDYINVFDKVMDESGVSRAVFSNRNEEKVKEFTETFEDIVTKTLDFNSESLKPEEEQKSVCEAFTEKAWQLKIKSNPFLADFFPLGRYSVKYKHSGIINSPCYGELRIYLDEILIYKISIDYIPARDIVYVSSDLNRFNALKISNLHGVDDFFDRQIYTNFFNLLEKMIRSHLTQYLSTNNEYWEHEDDDYIIFKNVNKGTGIHICPDQVSLDIVFKIMSILEERTESQIINDVLSLKTKEQL